MAYEGNQKFSVPLREQQQNDGGEEHMLSHRWSLQLHVRRFLGGPGFFRPHVFSDNGQRHQQELAFSLAQRFANRPNQSELQTGGAQSWGLHQQNLPGEGLQNVLKAVVPTVVLSLSVPRRSPGPCTVLCQWDVFRQGF